MALAVGDRVVIIDLPSGVADGLPEEEAPFVSEAVGREADVSERIDANTLEVSIGDPLTGIIHFIVLPEKMVLKKKLVR